MVVDTINWLTVLVGCRALEYFGKVGAQKPPETLCEVTKPHGDPSRIDIGWSHMTGLVLTCEVLSKLLIQLHGFVIDLICLFICLPSVHFPANDRRNIVLN